MFVHCVSNLAVKKVISTIRLLDSPVGITSQRHKRERWAVLLKTAGRTVYTVGDKTIVSDGLHPVILPKGCSYSWKCTEPGECIIIEFDADEEHNTFEAVEIKDNAVILNAFLKIEKNLSMKKTSDNLISLYYLYEILMFLLRSANKLQPHKKVNAMLEPAVEYIAKYYYDSSITNDTLAALCGKSTVYFRKTFDTVYGVSPIKYLHNFRIKKAMAILKSDYETIEQVALNVGYNSIYHFSKMFKQYTGVTPSEYAKTSRK